MADLLGDEGDQGILQAVDSSESPGEQLDATEVLKSKDVHRVMS